MPIYALLGAAPCAKCAARLLEPSATRGLPDLGPIGETVYPDNYTLEHLYQCSGCKSVWLHVDDGTSGDRDRRVYLLEPVGTKREVEILQRVQTARGATEAERAALRERVDQDRWSDEFLDRFLAVWKRGNTP